VNVAFSTSFAPYEKSKSLGSGTRAHESLLLAYAVHRLCKVTPIAGTSRCPSVPLLTIVSVYSTLVVEHGYNLMLRPQETIRSQTLTQCAVHRLDGHWLR
jgi:hypothetical protein